MCVVFQNLVNPGEIAFAAFSNCHGLPSVDLPEGLVTIGEDAFYQNKALLVSVYLPETVQTIGTDAFQKCLVLECASVPADIQSDFAAACTSGTPSGLPACPAAACAAGADSGDNCETAAACTTGDDGNTCQNGGTATGTTGTCACACATGSLQRR